MKFDMPKDHASIIKVIGVGGGGGNAVSHMYRQGIEGVDFVVCNTDNQALDLSPVPIKIQLGSNLTEGRGAGSKPEVGKDSAIENIDEVKNILNKNTKMVFITAGMGGGTGTGAAPVIAQTAREMGILTVGIVTIPFAFEGKKRKQQAELGIQELRQHVDCLLVICNDRLREMYGNLSIADAFENADNVLTTAAKGIAEIITRKGYINVDFEDVRTVMMHSGVAIMGSGMAEGDNRSVRAVEQALASPLLNDNNIHGAENVLLNITYGKEMSMDEVSEVTDYIQEEAGENANIIWGFGEDDSLGENICVTVVATGFEASDKMTYITPKQPEKKVMKLEDNTSMMTEKGQSEVFSPLASNPEHDAVSDEEIEPYLKSSEVNNEAPTDSENLGLFDHPSQRTIEFSVEEPSFDGDRDDNEPYLKPTEGSTKNQPYRENNTVETKSETPTNNHKKSASMPGYKEQQAGAQDRINKLRELSLKLKGQGGIAELENEPAYKRRNVELENAPHSSESNVSRFTLSDEEQSGESGEESRGTLRENNSFLHDNVD